MNARDFFFQISIRIFLRASINAMVFFVFVFLNRSIKLLILLVK